MNLLSPFSLCGFFFVIFHLPYLFFFFFFVFFLWGHTMFGWIDWCGVWGPTWYFDCILCCFLFTAHTNILMYMTYIHICMYVYKDMYIIVTEIQFVLYLEKLRGRTGLLFCFLFSLLSFSLLHYYFFSFPTLYLCSPKLYSFSTLTPKYKLSLFAHHRITLPPSTFVMELFLSFCCLFFWVNTWHVVPLPRLLLLFWFLFVWGRVQGGLYWLLHLVVCGRNYSSYYLLLCSLVK